VERDPRGDSKPNLGRPTFPSLDV